MQIPFIAVTKDTIFCYTVLMPEKDGLPEAEDQEEPDRAAAIAAVRGILRDKYGNVGSRANVEAAVAEAGTELPDDEDGRREVFEAHLAPLFADIETLADLAIRETELAKPALAAIARQIRELPDANRGPGYDAVARIIDAYGIRRLAPSFIDKLTEPLKSGLKGKDLWECAKRMSRNSAHGDYLTALAENPGTTMVTGRPLLNHIGAFMLKDDDIDGLEGQSLLLIGGGPTSPLPAQLAERGALPAEILNIDPGADEKATAPGYTAVRGTFGDSDVPAHRFQEAWALHSIPTYLPADEIPDAYAKAIRSLSKGGTFRIFPTKFYSAPVTPLLAFGTKMAWRTSQDFLDALKTRADLFTVAEFEGTEDMQHKKENDPTQGMMGSVDTAPLTMWGASVTIVGDPEEARRFAEETAAALKAAL